MLKLHLYVSEEVAAQLREQAKAHSMDLPEFLAEIVQRETRTGWPEGYFERVVGSWEGEALERPEPLDLDERDLL